LVARQPANAAGFETVCGQPHQFGKTCAGQQIVTLHVMQDFPVYPRQSTPQLSPIIFQKLQLITRVTFDIRNKCGGRKKA